MSDPGGPRIDQPRDPAGTGPVVLDAIALGKLRELDPDGRRGVVKRVLTAFDSSLDRWISQLEGQPDPPDAAALAAVVHIAHTLKSSASSVGAKDLARACAEVELWLRNGDPVDLPREIHRMVSLGRAALAAVRAMLQH